ncbi:uracil-DNA glycosylase [Vibrio caribbeanicus]|uniref:Uracil-DNA glycosylase n=1 Tax=Vibrio caribbeanicus ATCC BAA-2122 TaxID=796620 RepID=E3BN68_9VIBR|nr:uracil-DNA glycosylase [Vibrio caribbeanicus]EFP95510.1 uracil-DNA glycosylase [Vibrio caribbeanicus ATCC BAA-2122]
MNSVLTWQDVIGEEKQKGYFKEMMSFVEAERSSGKVVFPPKKDVFNAFKATKFSDIKVVMLGQDPYHGPNQAHGLCFSVKPGIKPPPSLVNIYKELASDIDGFEIPNHGYLQSWAEQGVLMLNTVLTVEQGKAHSHAKSGWEIFTDRVIEAIDQYHTGTIFVLWGSHAQKKGRFINRNKHQVLSGPHPSPLSAHRGFFGCRHFSKVNAILANKQASPIDWRLGQL